MARRRRRNDDTTMRTARTPALRPFPAALQLWPAPKRPDPRPDPNGLDNWDWLPPVTESDYIARERSAAIAEWVNAVNKRPPEPTEGRIRLLTRREGGDPKT